MCVSGSPFSTDHKAQCEVVGQSAGKAEGREWPWTGWREVVRLGGSQLFEGG